MPQGEEDWENRSNFFNFLRSWQKKVFLRFSISFSFVSLGNLPFHSCRSINLNFFRRRRNFPIPDLTLVNNFMLRVGA